MTGPETDPTLYYAHEQTRADGSPYFAHLHRSMVQMSLCGPGEVIVVRVTILDEADATEEDYWGWLSDRETRPSMIFPKWFLLNMCFPAGAKKTEAAGQGKILRLRVEKETT